MPSRPPPHSPAPAKPETLHVGVRFHQAGDYPAAYRCCERILQREPANLQVRWQIGRTLIKLKEPRRAVPHLRQVTDALPQVPDPHYDLAMAQLGSHQWEEAAASFAAAAKLRPDWIEAWSNLGQALTRGRRYQEAEDALRHALALKPDHTDSINRLGIVRAARGQLDEAIELHLQAIARRPGFVEAWSNLGFALTAQNKLDEALVAFRQALTIDPKRAEVRLNQSYVNLVRGDFSRSVWLQNEFRWIVMNFNPDRGGQRKLWRGEEPVAGKSVLLYAEQGLGDTLQFIRYAPLLAARGATVHLEVQPELKGLLSPLPGIASIVGRGEPLPPFDLQCPLLSLPLAMGTQLDTIPCEVPYLRAPVERIRHWAAQLPASTGNPRIGVVWRGNPKHVNDANRSIPFETFQRLLARESCEFVCLQFGLNEREAAALATLPACLRTAAKITDFTDTAALIAQLDLVVTVDTSVAHLAGAMGKTVWVLLPFAPDWRWLLARSDSPWYPTARLFRQPAVRDWDSVIAQVSRELATVAMDGAGARQNLPTH